MAVSNEHSCSALLVLQLQAFLAAAAHPRLLFPLWTEGYLNYTAKRMFDYCSQQGMTRFMDYTPKFRLVIINTNSLLHNHKYICAAALSQPQPQVLAPYPVGVGAVPGLIAPRPSFQRSSMRCSRLSMALVSCMWCLGYLMDDHSR